MVTAVAQGVTVIVQVFLALARELGHRVSAPLSLQGLAVASAVAVMPCRPVSPHLLLARGAGAPELPPHPGASTLTGRPCSQHHFQTTGLIFEVFQLLNLEVWIKSK